MGGRMEAAQEEEGEIGESGGERVSQTSSIEVDMMASR